ncbi:hypothetical protein Tco_0712751 [Tanacetum coccineum]
MSSPKFAETHNVVAFLEKPVESNGFTEIIDFLKESSVHYALTVNPIIYTSCIEQLWATAKVQTVNGVRQLQALVDKKRVIVTDSSIRRDLRMDDAEGTDCLLTATIFEELATYGCSIASLIICLATNQKFNLSKYIFDAMVKHLDGGVKFLSMISVSINSFFATYVVQASKEVGEDSGHLTDSTQEAEVSQDETEHEESVPTPSNDLQPSEKAKDAQAKRLTALKKRIQRLERKKMSRPAGLKRSSELLCLGELMSLKIRRGVWVLLRCIQTREFWILFELLVEANVDEKSLNKSTKLDDSTAGEVVTTASVKDSAAPTTTASVEDGAAPTTIEEITLAQTLIQIKAAKPKVEPSEFRVPQEAQPLISKDKGKVGYAELIEEKKLARKQEEEANIALIESWENTQAMIEADRLLAERLQSKEREELTDEEKTKRKIFMGTNREKRIHFVATSEQQEKEKQPPYKGTKETQMSTYIKKWVDTHTKQLKGKSFDEIKNLFEKEMKRVNTFVAMGSEVQESKEKMVEESSKKQRMEEEKESDEDELKKPLVIKKDEDIAIDAIPLATKLPVIIDYKLHKEGMLVHYQLIRADVSSKRYSSMIMMLQGIDREDLEALWRIVKTKYSDIRTEDEFERVFWGDLKVMFELDKRSDVWRILQGYRVTI